jgi:putative peptidoglycan lipid II flippase
MPTSRSSLRWVFWLSVASVGQLLLQFCFQMLLARQFGAAADMDAYASAMALPTVIGTILAASLGQSFVPLFIDLRMNSGDKAAWDLASSWGGLLILVLGAVSALGTFFAGPLMAWLQPGFDLQQQEVTARLFRVVSWLILTNCLSTFLSAVYQCHQRFAPPPLAGLTGIVVSLVWTVFWTRTWGIMAAATGVLAGSVVTIVILASLVGRHWTWRIRLDETLRRSTRLWAPLLAGATYYNLGPLVDRYLASSLPTGNISHLAYASRVTLALLALSTYSLLTVMFPVLASHKSSGEKEGLFAAEITRSIRFLLFLLMPLVVGLICFSQPLVHDLFERGKFGPQDTIAVGQLVALYAGMFLGASLVEITARAFFALHDARTPVLVGIVAFTLGVFLKVLLCQTHGLAGIVVATSLYYLLNAAVLLWLLYRRLKSFPLQEALYGLLRSLMASLVTALAAWLVLQLRIPYSAVIAACLGAAVYVISASMLGDEFARSLLLAVTRRRSA